MILDSELTRQHSEWWDGALRYRFSAAMPLGYTHPTDRDSHYLLPTTHYLLPTTHYLLPTTHYPLPFFELYGAV
jgi:hypothetical protein